MPRACWLALGALAAALAGTEGGPPALALLAAAAFAAWLGGRIARRAWPIAVAAGVLLLCARFAAGALATHTGPESPVPSGSGPWTAAIVSLSTPSAGAQRAVLRLEGPKDGSPGVLVWAQLPRYPEIVPGDRVVVEGPLRSPPDGSFGAYLRRTGVAATLTAYRLDLAGADAGPLAWLERRRRDAGELLAITLPAPQAGLAAGIVVGLRDRVDRDLAADFTTAGLSHVVAISGWNIAVVAGVLASLLRRLSRRWRSMATLAVVAAYSLAAGGGASVVRAALMAASVIVVRESGRRGRAADALGIASTAMLLLHPAVVMDAGFQLSAAATAGLLAWGDRLTSWLAGRLPGQIPGWVVETLGISLAAQAATFPLVILDFGRISLVAPAANLVAAPLVTPVMAASAAALGAGWLVSLGAPGVLGSIVGGIGSVIVGTLVAVVRVAAAVPWASVSLEPPLTWMAAAASAAAIGAAAGGRSGTLGRLRDRLRERRARGGIAAHPHPATAPGSIDRSRPSRQGTADAPTSPNDRHARSLALSKSDQGWAGRLIAVAGAAAIALVLLVAAAPDRRLHVSVLDVGQGDAILLTGPAGSRLLVDAGPDPDVLVARLDERVPAWDRRIDIVVLTHPHDDHVGGMAALLRRYAVGQVLENGMRGAGPGARACDEALAASGITTGALAAGDRLVLDGATILVRWPEAGTVPRAPPLDGSGVNDASIVLDLRYGERRVLLTGDIEEGVDPHLLSLGVGGPAEPPVDLLKVAHHGSRTSSTAELLAALRPRLAVVSVGTGNPYGHPADATLERLEATGARVWRTDRDGSVSVSTNGRDLTVEVGGRVAWTALDPGGQPSVAGVPRIDAWPFPPVALLRHSFFPSIRRRGCSRTSWSSRRWPPSSPSGRPRAASRWTGASSRRRRCSTTSTSSFRRTTRYRSSGMAKPAHGG